ncbi:MAG TPA: hypothetical protein QF761_13200 [Pirellulales bacterium]|nr:hypothetical protein [Pirellulales bacterium]
MSIQQHPSIRSAVSIVIGVVLFAAMTTGAHAHFSWLSVIQKDGAPVIKLHFSEAAHVPGAHIPEKIGSTSLLIWDATGTKHQAATEPIETDDSVSREVKLPTDIACSVQATCKYGIYHSFLLTYYPKAIYLKGRTELPAVARAANQKFDIVPSWHEYGLELTALWDGQPQAGVAISVIGPDEEEKEYTTNKKGRVLISDVASGLYGIRAHYTAPDSAGTFEGQKYDEEQHFATLTLNVPPENGDSNADADTITMPNPIASFGAATTDGYLYIYGGHTGRAHSHSRQNLSPHFFRIPLRENRDWEELPMETHAQGLALVAHGKYLYRVGGFNARNEIDDLPDLHSVNEFSRYDPEKHAWEALPDMPFARSSHDAVVVGDTLFVVGGWELSGDSDGDWHDTALEIDLSSDNPQWKTIKDVPFERRALATATIAGKVFALCGMTSDGEISQDVNIYDPKTGLWTLGPQFPGEEMAGFGISAWGDGEELLATGIDGVVYRLTRDHTKWERLTKLKQGRFFHRLLPAGKGKFAMVGGASLNGHINRIDFFEIP